MTQIPLAGTGPAPITRQRDQRPGLGRLARDSALMAGRYLRVLRSNPARLIYPLLPLALLHAGEAVASLARCLPRARPARRTYVPKADGT